MIDVNLMPGVEEDVDAELNYNEDFLEIDGISISLQSLGNVINGIIDKGYIEASDVASFESISPGCLLDNHTISEFGGVFSSEAFNVSLEGTINTEFDLAMHLTGKVLKFIGNSAVKLAGVVKVCLDDKAINSFKKLFSTSIHHQETLKDIKWSDLTNEQKQKLVKLVQSYSGISTIGEKETLELLNVVKHAKTSLDVMNKFYLPKHSNILIPLFYIPSSNYKQIVNFFEYNDKTMMPKIETNLNLAVSELSTIMEKRDWVGLSRFDVDIFNRDNKEPIWKLATAVHALVKPDARFSKNLSRISKAINPLLDHDKRGKVDAPKFNQDLTNHLLDLEKIKNSVISISETMMDMHKTSETKAGKLSHDLRSFRASKTIKESLQTGRVGNKYSNANYSRVMKELKELSIYCEFMASASEKFVKTYMGVNHRVNKLNNETTDFIIHVNKIIGANNA